MGSTLVVAINFISQALAKKTQGDGCDYMFIVQQLESGTSKSKWIQSLTGCVDAVVEDHSELVNALLSMRWECEGDVTTHYKELILSLCSAQPCFVPDVLAMLVSRLLPREDDEEEEKAQEEEGAPAEQGQGAFEAVHNVLSQVLVIAPLCLEQLLQLLVRNFPHKLRAVDMQVCYLQNVLRILVYAPSIQDKALAAIVDRLVEIDVEIKLEEHMEEEPVFAMEDDDSQDDSEMLNEMADKLDEMLKLVYQFLTTFAKDADEAMFKETFAALLGAFERSILPVHKSKYAQFVVFYGTSLHSSLPQVFLEFLLLKAGSATEALMMRQTCVAYVGSYLARFQPLREETLRAAFDFLIKEAQKYLRELPPDRQFPEPTMHALFYTICQSILYAACYKREELINIGLELSAALEEILSCSLDPIRFCLEAVSREFVKVAPMLGLEWDKCRTSLSLLEEANVTNCANQLEMFFPFDPYLLEESGCFIDDIYEDWKYGGGDDEDEDEMASPRGAHAEFMAGGSLDDMCRSLSDSLTGMSFEQKIGRSDGGRINVQIRPRSLSGMGHSLNSRSLCGSLSNSPGFQEAKIGPYKRRKKAYSPEGNRKL